MTGEPAAAPRTIATEPEHDAADRPIGDYAAIGDTHSGALVATNGSIDWACLPRFDSPAVFLGLLDRVRGGFFQIAPTTPYRTRRAYRPGTNVLETTFEIAGGVVTVTDFMPVQRREQTEGGPGEDVAGRRRITRKVECRAGRVELALTVKPTFDYARAAAETSLIDGAGAVFAAANHRLVLGAPGPLRLAADGIETRYSLGTGDTRWIGLTYLRPGEDSPRLAPEDLEAELEETTRYWRDWSDDCTYAGPFKDVVVRSALTLKLLTFEPTGAILAALTTSLPEEIGGVRNWDYRFMWLRDATFTLTALLNLGYTGEARDFLGFIHKVCACPAEDFQIMYGINGERELMEQTLDHLAGYRASRPVRIGNAAFRQLQLDIYGELIDCVCLYYFRKGFERHGETLAGPAWTMVRHAADFVVRHWRRADSGIWEVRGSPRHFVHSKASCWVALDRALEMAQASGLEGDLGAWREARDEIRTDVLAKGFDARLGAFTQSYGDPALDAANLRLALLGFLPADDPRMKGTIEQTEKRLMRNGLVYRYLGADDGLPGGEGTFAICTLWLVQCLHLLGRTEDAEELFRHVISFANDVGLFAEEIDPVRGELLGNFPQAFTHIALINTAVRLWGSREQKQTLRPTAPFSGRAA